MFIEGLVLPDVVHDEIIRIIALEVNEVYEHEKQSLLTPADRAVVEKSVQILQSDLLYDCQVRQHLVPDAVGRVNAETALARCTIG